MCHEEIFEHIFLFEKSFLSKLFSKIKQKIFQISEKTSAGLAILHPISFDEYSDASFGKESTLIKVSSFEKKEQRSIWFYSKSPPFF